ncbi:unnamed protein product, partial [marine sediment metagenome]
ITLLPIAFPPQWRVITATWNIRVRWDTVNNYIIWQRRIGTWPFAFRFTFGPIINRWCMNELLAPTGNFAYAGSATVSWYGL